MSNHVECTEQAQVELGGAAGAAAMNLFQPGDEEDSGGLDVDHKTMMVSPSDEQFSLLHKRLGERLQQGETIYEIGIGGMFY